MFGSPQTSPFGRQATFAVAYSQIGHETGMVDASPHKLVSMLFDGFMDAVSRARGAMRKGDVDNKCRAIRHAARIIDEGLKAGLNLQQGGDLAEDLRALYEYTAMRLTQANLRNDEKLLDECVSLIEPLRQAWAGIAHEVE